MVSALSEKISTIIRNPLKNRGYDLVQINISRSLKSRSKGMRNFDVDVFIDRFDNKPVSMDDCSAANQLISAILDVEDLINQKYNLNVSSPGEIRPVDVTVENFKRFYDHEFVIELNEPENISEGEKPKRKIKGVLISVNESEARFKKISYEDEVTVRLSNMKKARVNRFIAQADQNFNKDAKRIMKKNSIRKIKENR